MKPQTGYIKRKIEREDIRLTVKVLNEEHLDTFATEIKRVFGKKNVEVEEARLNLRPGFGNLFAYIHIHIPEGASRT